MQKRVYIETYGCQMNEHDSEQILRLLERSNYLETKDAQEADLVLVNTCSVREKPEQKVYSALGRFKGLKEEKGTIIGVAGCVAQQEGQRLLARIPYLDMVIGTHAIPLIPKMLERAEVIGEKVCETGFDTEGKHLDAFLPQGQVSVVKSYVTIIQGCNHFCSYCIVPYVRGRERSRPNQEIVDEVSHLAQRGVKEICLLGQNVNSYGKGLKEEIKFPELLSRLDEIEGVGRIRFTTSHPKDLSEELIQAHGRLKKLCEHIHLPFQSGSNGILKAMNRGYTRESYVEKIDRLREVCPSIAITSDVIAGFPGEEEKDFEETLDLMKKVRFDDLFSFKYSPRKGTMAAGIGDQVEEQVKQERLAVLQKIQKEITLQKNQALEGHIEEVLVEGYSKQSERDVTGRTRTNKTVNFEGDLGLVGRLVQTKITKAYAHSLRGEIVPSDCGMP
ncbi:MAG: tRNA (N6-isopentenyl adenosine(37)-C2)-methylthiotransferase MiaB, partial [Deltaproteobacteria bacterium]|nr:tRNA (N6-isopentenyl adenosine(37)-C2)-methylthiotransferase MiaB [Deltaproteobacteria bacterium]